MDLFRLMLEKPRPWVPTDVVPGGRVFAISALEQWRIAAATAGLSSHEVGIVRARHMVAAGLGNRGGLLFGDAADCHQLPAHDLHRYQQAVEQGWAACMPAYSDSASRIGIIKAKLTQGARKIPQVALALGACVDQRNGCERPDWFFGVNLRDLTDGQWMAFRACRDLVAEWRKTNG